MKFDCGPTWQERVAAKEKWHIWFAWHPVRLGSRHCRWLEEIWRKGKQDCGYSGCPWDWEYKELTE